ncbi:MAG TPA: GspH/FimT family pseudopilin [Burkholderiaceae bacterium]|nr:GspH/FimT family pseudopilin [Burkholderiaceae bacterium]
MKRFPPMFSARPARRSGFTLIELLVTIVIAAILVAAAVPMFNSSISRANIRDAANGLLAAVELARSEAIRRGVRVSVCRVNNPWGNPPVCGTAVSGAYAAGDWATGWIIFTDNGATVGVFDTTEEVLYTQPPFDGGGASRTQIDGGPAVGFFTLNPDGTLTAAGGALGFNLRYPQGSGTALNTATVTSTVLGQTTVTVN